MSSSVSSDEYAQAKKWALAQLARREMSAKQLKAKLQKRRVSERCSDQIIAECIEKGFIDDARFCEMVITAGKLKGHGPRRVQLALQRKGLAKEQLDYSEGEERHVLARTLQPLLERNNISDFKKKRRVFAAMVRRGFQPRLVAELLDAAQRD